MDLGALRALVSDVNFSAHGVPATVTRPFPDDTPIETIGIWLTPITEDVPLGVDFQKREARHVFALQRSTVPTVPRGTIILAPEWSHGTALRWRVDGHVQREADHTRVTVVPEPEPY